MADAWKSYGHKMLHVHMNAIFKMCTHDLERIQISSHLLQSSGAIKNWLALISAPFATTSLDVTAPEVYQVARCSKFWRKGLPAKDPKISMIPWNILGHHLRIWIPLCENGQDQVQSWDAWLQNGGTKTRPLFGWQLGGGLKYLLFSPLSGE